MADGYLMVSVHQKQVQWEQLKGYDKPIILIDEYNPNHDSVSVDSVEGSYLATKHLIDQGFERIALISASPNSKPMFDRKTGYKRAIEDSGRMVNEEYIFISDDLYRDGFSEENGYESMKRIIRDFPTVEAVVCASDIQALGALKAMKDADVRFPIIGFDDIPISRYLGLSTMKQPMYEMGTLALEKLLHRIQHPDSMISHTVFSPELVVRETSLSVQITH
jgi:LacI family transcriptional regulator